MNSSVAVMQPYFFPYIGYFQLIQAVEKFIIYDDVGFIKRGWINRNNILINGKENLITIPCRNASQNKLINEINHGLSSKNRKKLLNKIQFAYGKAPFFDTIFPIVQEVILCKKDKISDLAFLSITAVCSYLEIETKFKKSSKTYKNSRLDKAGRLINITKQEHAENYINPIGGTELYDKETFKKEGVNLFFLKPEELSYTQFGNQFVPWLSIIDVMMFNSVEEIHGMLQKYRLI